MENPDKTVLPPNINKYIEISVYNIIASSNTDNHVLLETLWYTVFRSVLTPYKTSVKGTKMYLKIERKGS